MGERTTERLQKVLSQWGIASRRQAEELVIAGRVSVNNHPAHVGQKIDPMQDQVEIDGQRVNPACAPERIYLLMNKPLGVVSTCDDPQARRTVLDLLPPNFRQGKGIHPVGRLDANSTGALILTNDGNLTFQLTHPRHHIPKTYRIWVQGLPSDRTLSQWRAGVVLDDRPTLPADVAIMRHDSNQKTLLEIVMYEGRNRQIRRVAEQLGHPVLHLHRIAIGPIRLQAQGSAALPSGQHRQLSDFEICFLNSQIGLTSNMERELIEECKL